MSVRTPVLSFRPASNERLADNHPPSFQLSLTISVVPTEPVDGAVLYHEEVARRNAAILKGYCRTGCLEIDEDILMGLFELRVQGGFEPGTVVGISSEDDHFALALGLQTISHLLLSPTKDGRQPKAFIVTTGLMSPDILLVNLTRVLETHARFLRVKEESIKDQVQACLEQISISWVFDFDGLLEVFKELDDLLQDPGHPNNPGPPSNQRGQAQDKKPFDQRTEVPDSEDEGSFTSDEPSQSQPHTAYPDIVFITNMTIIMRSIFVSHEKDHARKLINNFAARLHNLSRSTEHNLPLIIIGNSTRNKYPMFQPSPNPAEVPQGGPEVPQGDTATSPQLPPGAKPAIAPTLRSIFNPRPVTIPGLGDYDTPRSRRNTPAFGLIFTQLLDLHLLCTRMPSPLDSTLMIPAPTESLLGFGAGLLRSDWAVEVLLDNLGIWNPDEARPGGKPRTNREGTWGYVDCIDGNIYCRWGMNN